MTILDQYLDYSIEFHIVSFTINRIKSLIQHKCTLLNTIEYCLQKHCYLNRLYI